MKRSVLSVLALATATLLLPAHTADVKLTITGVEAQGGILWVGLQTEDQFMKPAGEHVSKIEAPTAGTHTITLTDVEPGTYSVSAFHDLDGDVEMDLDENYRPKEGWGMNKGTELRGAPTFANVSFDVPSGGTALSIEMIYPQ